MEMNEESIIKKSKKIPQWLIIGYIICVIAIIGSIFVMIYRKEYQMPEAIDFTTDGAVGMEASKYAYLDVQGLSEEVAIYGDIENEKSSANDRYYIAFNKGYMYVVDLDFETIEQLKPWQDYVYSQEATEEPEAVKIYGTTEEISDELKQMVMDFCNKDLPEKSQIKMENFEAYFGSVLLNIRKSPINTSVEKGIIFLSIIALMILVIIHIAKIVKKAN